MTGAAHRTACCVVGAGPAGTMLSLLLARAGVPVTLLEMHRDFDREFRGDTIHPSTLEVLAQLKLAQRLHRLPHVKAASFQIVSPNGVDTMAVYERLPTPFPYMMIMPQARFLEFLTEEARRYPHFRLVMGANVERLIEEQGAIAGVGYRTADDRIEVRAPLTVATDGRFSRIRRLAHLEPVRQSEPMEVLWFRLPRRADDPHGEASLNNGRGAILAVLGRPHEWQIGYVAPKGRYHQLKADGLERLRDAVTAVLPWLADRVDLLSSWGEINLLSVEGSRLTCWHRPGLLLIGDAAHVMLPVGGVGINCAIADAVEAANVLVTPLREQRLQESHLAEVQRRRELITRIIQRFQAVAQKGFLTAAASGQAARPPPLLRALIRVPGLRNVPGRITAFGVRRVRIEHPEEEALAPALAELS